MRRKLVIGYDGSSRGGDAIALGAVLAGYLDGDPLIVTVTRRPAASDGPDPLLALPSVAGVLGHLDPDQRIVVEGPPGRSLVEAATAADPVAAVVVGSTHRGRLGQAVLGGVGATLLSEASCAVAIAPRGYVRRWRRDVERIGVAFMGAAEERPALDAAGALAQRLDTTLTLFGVVEPIRYSYASSESRDPTLSPASQLEAREDEMAQRLRRAAILAPPEVETEALVLTGDAVGALERVGEKVDLLFIGSRGHGQLKRALLGSVSGRLVGSPPCPMLAFPRRCGRDPLGILDAERGRVTPIAER